MASIPLPALSVQAPQPNDPLASFQRLMALKSLANQQQGQQQEMQIRQQQIQDTQATTAAMKTWDGQDYDALSKSVLQNGGSANAATAIQQHGLTVKKTVSDIAAQDAATGSKNLETFIGKHKAIGDALEGIENVPDDQLQAHALAKVQDLMKSGILDPQTAQQTAAAIQSAPDPQHLRSLIDITAKSSMGAKAAAEQAKTESEAAKNQAETEQKRQESQFYQRSGVGAPGVPADVVQMTDWLRQNPGKTPADYPAAKAGAVAQSEAPTRIATAEAEGRARATIEAQTARGSSAALANVPPHLVAPASAQATKAGEDYAQAQSVTQRLNAMMDAARGGNVVAYQVMPEEGTLQITTSQGVHRINKTEIDQYAGGGSLWQRLMGHVGKTLTGESIPKSVLDDMAEIQKIQSEGSQLKYNNSLKTINQTYGANFQPVQMDELQRNTQHVAGGASHGLQEGATGTGSDGKKYIVKDGKWTLKP